MKLFLDVKMVECKPRRRRLSSYIGRHGDNISTRAESGKNVPLCLRRLLSDDIHTGRNCGRQLKNFCSWTYPTFTYWTKLTMSGQCVICQVNVPGLGYNWTGSTDLNRTTDVKRSSNFQTLALKFDFEFSLEKGIDPRKPWKVL